MRFFGDEDGQRAILSVIAAKPTRSITDPELRSAVADHLATQINRTLPALLPWQRSPHAAVVFDRCPASDQHRLDRCIQNLRFKRGGGSEMSRISGS